MIFRGLYGLLLILALSGCQRFERDVVKVHHKMVKEIVDMCREQHNSSKWMRRCIYLTMECTDNNPKTSIDFMLETCIQKYISENEGNNLY